MIFEPKYPYKLPEEFIREYQDKQPAWGPLGYITYKRTYARAVEGEDRTEEFWETIRRVVEGCFTVIQTHDIKNQRRWEGDIDLAAADMYERMFSFKLLPPGRGLWGMGTNALWLRGSAMLNNCAFVSTKDIDINPVEPFTFMADMSMLGVGVAFDTAGAGSLTIRPVVRRGTFTPEDSKEGWVSCIEQVLSGYFKTGIIPEHFDYSLIRPAGSPIRTFGGIAPGPEPLRVCVDTLIVLLAKKTNHVLATDSIVDVMNLIGRCVVSGGVRRSAQAAFGNHDDDVFIALKDPETASDELRGWRWASNNSVFCKSGMDYSVLAEQTARNGEPGYLWMDNHRGFGRGKDGNKYPDINVTGVNPCQEMSLESFELCNLIETFPSRHDSYNDYENTLNCALLYGKAVTLIPTHYKPTNEIIRRNRRIGISQSGITEQFTKVGREEHLKWCDRGYEFLRRRDAHFSEMLGVNRSVKLTTVKPSGTVSLLVGTSPGIHYPYSRYYYRTIRLDKTSDVLDVVRRAGYRIEESVYGDGTLVAYFPVANHNHDKFAGDVSMLQQLRNMANMQYFWADNSVSCTVTFQPDEADEIQHVLPMFDRKLKCVSFLPFQNHRYKQAPYIPITEEEYRRAIQAIKPMEFNANTHELEDKFCDSEYCMI